MNDLELLERRVQRLETFVFWASLFVVGFLISLLPDHW